jgi:hypothetical protein
MYVQIMERPAHPIWATSAIRHGVEPWFQRVRETDVDFLLPFPEADVLQNVFERSYIKEITVYLTAHGLKHCRHVARQRSMFDAFWEHIFHNALHVRSKVLSLSLCVAAGWPLWSVSYMRMIIEDRHPLVLPLLNL